MYPQEAVFRAPDSLPSLPLSGLTPNLCPVPETRSADACLCLYREPLNVMASHISLLSGYYL